MFANSRQATCVRKRIIKQLASERADIAGSSVWSHLLQDTDPVGRGHYARSTYERRVMLDAEAFALLDRLGVEPATAYEAEIFFSKQVKPLNVGVSRDQVYKYWR